MRFATLTVFIAFANLMMNVPPLHAQNTTTVHVIRRAVVMETPRGDSLILGSVDAGQVLEVVSRQGNWFEVLTPPGMARPRGWIYASAVDAPPSLRSPAARTATAVAAPRPGKKSIRGFAQAGGTRFSANNSFDAIVGSAFGTVFGAGAEIVFPSGGFIQGHAERFRKTGSRVLVSGTQLFTLQIPDVVTVTPIEVTLGYRDTHSRRALPYVGVGAGWLTLREASDSLPDVTVGHLGYHILGGVEIPLVRWVSVAGEVQWTAAPKALGDTGISAVYKEDDFGGIAFRVKLIVGR
jgi:hypothetical protein